MLTEKDCQFRSFGYEFPAFIAGLSGLPFLLTLAILVSKGAFDTPRDALALGDGVPAR